MWLTIILAAILFACLASMVTGGLWNNALIFVNVVTAALLASNYWEPLAIWLQKQRPDFTYYADFIAQWALFVLCMVVLRGVTDLLSRVKVRFKKPVNLAGGILFALWTGWMLVCFTTWTLHTAPLAQSPLGGEFAPTPDERMFLGLGPDRLWLGFLHKQSTGAMRRGGTAQNPNLHEFDPQGEYLFKYAERRKRFESEMAERVNVKK